MVINPRDNVEIRDDGHKYALRDIAEGEDVIKYGMPIGHATRAIARSIFAFGIFARRAFSSTIARLGFIAGSVPALAAIAI